VLWVIALLWLILFSIFLIYKISNLLWNLNIINNNQLSWDVYTWTDSGEIWPQKIILLTDTWFRNENKLSINFFPKVKINRLPENLTLVVNIDFSEWFKNLYSDYTNSAGYGFAISFFMDTFNNGWFYNVFRKTNGWVWNDYTKWLTWWVIGKDLNGGYIRRIPLNKPIPIAVDFEKVSIGNQFIYTDPSNYLNTKIWKETTFGIYLSSVKEIPWRRIMYIKELSLEYEWYENDIELLNN